VNRITDNVISFLHAFKEEALKRLLAVREIERIEAQRAVSATEVS
jgi:hypothetical protein